MKEAFDNAQKWSGLKVLLTGALGKRTRFQTFNTAQLIIEASSSARGIIICAMVKVCDRNSKFIGEETIEHQKTEHAPRVVQNDDPTLLSTPNLVTPVKEENLRVIDQSILLALWYLPFSTTVDWF